jgi:hypothetical protein
MLPQQLGILSVQSLISTAGKGTGSDEARKTGMAKFLPTDYAMICALPIMSLASI